MKQKLKELEDRDSKEFDRLAEELNSDSIDVDEYHKAIIIHGEEYRRRLAEILNLL